MRADGEKKARGMGGRRRDVALSTPQALLFAGAVAATSCSAEASRTGSQPALSGEQVLDPRACQTCHPTHYAEWAASVHASASDDPVFVAMNARYQRETGGARPAFCIQCHAPIAVRAGATVGGENLGALPESLRGVTCFACHAVDAVQGTHDAPFHWADDGALRGALPAGSPGDPRPPHGAVYSPLLDHARPEAASLCGACHDVQTPAGVDVETTFAEWRTGMASHAGAPEFATCGGCHMPVHDGAAAAVAGAPQRTVHGHGFVAVDLPPVAAMSPGATDADAAEGGATDADAAEGGATDAGATDAGADRDGGPNSYDARASVARALGAVLVGRLCMTAPIDNASSMTAALTLENAFAGHAWPSGAAHDRRAWVEIVAYGSGSIVFSSGVVPTGGDVTASTDADLWLLRTRLFDTQSSPVRMMWQAATATASALPVAVTPDPRDPRYDHSVERTWHVPAATDRVTVRMLLLPVGLDVLDDLVASGDLDPGTRDTAAARPPYVIGGASLDWSRAADGFGCVP